jgi:hypothetical protein
MDINVTERIAFRAGDREVFAIEPDGRLIIQGEVAPTAGQLTEAFASFVAHYNQQAREGKDIIRIVSQAGLAEEQLAQNADLSPELRETMLLAYRVSPLVHLNFVLFKDVMPNTLIGILESIKLQVSDMVRRLTAEQQLAAQLAAESKAKAEAQAAQAEAEAPKAEGPVLNRDEAPAPGTNIEDKGEAKPNGFVQWVKDQLKPGESQEGT